MSCVAVTPRLLRRSKIEEPHMYAIMKLAQAFANCLCIIKILPCAQARAILCLAHALHGHVVLGIHNATHACSALLAPIFALAAPDCRVRCRSLLLPSQSRVEACGPARMVWASLRQVLLVSARL